jgi:two-component system, OmpR family, sensor histidine kinase TctE
MKLNFSLRRQLLVGILLPVAVLVIVNTISTDRQTLQAINTAYDRTLLASAKTIGESLTVEGYDEAGTLSSSVPYAALEAFETDNQSLMYYRVANLRGQTVSGFADLPRWTGRIPDRGVYAALVDFYDDHYQGQPVRIAVLLQPVASERGRTMAVIQVAETLQLRQALAQRILWDTLMRQALLLAVVAAVVVAVVQYATRPVRRISHALQNRPEGQLTAIEAPDAPRELLPLIAATNQVMQRLAHLLENQKRFVRDTAHQLRTPLAVLTTQVQSALRGDMPATQALGEIEGTVHRATALANQMLSLAKVEQLRQQSDAATTDWSVVLREVALDVSPLIADKDLNFDIATERCLVRAHDWMLRELARNLLHNAVAHSPPGAALSVRLRCEAHTPAPQVTLTVVDEGPGISEQLRPHLFQPFSSGRAPGDGPPGSGLGLAICHEIVVALGGSLELDNRTANGKVLGLDAVVRLPLDNHAV